MAAEVLALLQQAQEAQPAVSRALAEQQQPPRQRLVPQSKALEQGSPGEDRAQEPVRGEHWLQPARAAEALQQKPPLQEAEAQEASREHWEPAMLMMD